jgi:hypothetical protein
MAVLIALAAMLCACYSPELHDCTLACASSNDCAGDQTCTADHLCAASGATCAADAGRSIDAPQQHAPPPPPPDAAGVIALHVHVDGAGAVTASPCDTSCTCDSPLLESDCVIDVVDVTQAQLAATPHTGEEFQTWMGPPCMGQPATCVFATMPTPAMISVKFRRAS